jgi:hypothetical protein
MVASYSKCLEETLNGNLCLWPVQNSQQGYEVHFVSKNMKSGVSPPSYIYIAYESAE